MFRVITSIGILLIAAIIVTMMRSSPGSKDRLLAWLRGKSKDVGDMLQQIGSSNLAESLPSVKKMFYGITLISFFLLVLSGFLPVVIVGGHLSGFFLMQHMVAAPVFVLGMAGLTLLYAYQLRITANDWATLYQAFRRNSLKENFITKNRELLKKAVFWVSVILSIAVILPIILSMYPIYGPEEQESLLHLHGYSGLLLLVVFVIYGWSAAASQNAGQPQKPRESAKKRNV